MIRSYHVNFSHVDSGADAIYKDLQVPVEAKEVDLLMFFYKEKNGEIKVCEKGMQIAQYFNISVSGLEDVCNKAIEVIKFYVEVLENHHNRR